MDFTFDILALCSGADRLNILSGHSVAKLAHEF